MKKRKSKKQQELTELDESMRLPEPEPEVPKRVPDLELSSTQMLSPVMDICDGVIVTKDDRYVQIIEVEPINFMLFPDNEQDAIADAFGASLSAYPNQFHIKILSRQASVDNHIENYQKAMATETNENCRKMQMHSIQKIRQNGMNSITRRFFIAHAYEHDGGIRRPSFDTIRESLTRTSLNIAHYLGSKPCSNELSAPIGSNDAQLDALYQCMNRIEAEDKPLIAKVEEVVQRYADKGMLQGDKDTILPNDFIAPKFIDPANSHYLIQDGKYIGYGFINGNSYGGSCPSGWMQSLINLGVGIDVDIFVERRPTATVRRELLYAMRWKESDMSGKSMFSADVDDVENILSDGLYIRSQLSNQQSLYDFSVMLTIVADSEEDLYWRQNSIRKSLSQIGLAFTPLHYRHLDAWISALPLCNWDKSMLKRAKRNILGCDFGSAYPFASYALNDKGGIMIGVNKTNLSPVFLNLHDRTLYSNGNMFLLGPPGTGKTYCLQTMALALRQLGVQVIIVVPYKGYEYRRACEAVGGQFITIAPGSPNNINIMEIRKYDTSVKEQLEGGKEAQRSILGKQIDKISAFIHLIKPDLTALEAAALDDALRLTYKDFGITENNKSLIDPANPTKYKKMPLLGDLYNKLVSKAKDKEYKNIEGLIAVLQRFVTGSAKSFNTETNVNLDNLFVVLDISEMPKELVPVGTFIAHDFSFDCLRADATKPKALFNDEISRIIGVAGSELAAEHLISSVKLVRAYNAVCINATQDTNDFFALKDGIYGRQIVSNSKFQIILRQEPQEAKTVRELLNLSPAEVNNIQYYNPGEGLLIANRNHVEIKIIASEYEDSLINTDPEHIKRRLQNQQVS